MNHNCLEMPVVDAWGGKDRGIVRAVWIHNGNLYFLVQYESGELKDGLAHN